MTLVGTPAVEKKDRQKSRFRGSCCLHL